MNTVKHQLAACTELENLIQSCDRGRAKSRSCGNRIVTRSGRSLTGRVLAQGDYRSPALRLQTDILDGGSIEEIPKAEIESHQTVPLSVMPEGLLNSLTAQEIADLIAWLATGNIQE